jgi:hypothetical protein
MRSAIFFNYTQRRMAVLNQIFGTTNRSHLQSSISPIDCLNLGPISCLINSVKKTTIPCCVKSNQSAGLRTDLLSHRPVLHIYRQILLVFNSPNKNCKFTVSLTNIMLIIGLGALSGNTCSFRMRVMKSEAKWRREKWSEGKWGVDKKIKVR